ncbi:MAG: ABC-type spermidine/putrescine transport system, permease component II [halophilic archaeon J07HX64]|jgi:ABC-type spermidine/putrescine transport system, permease component II|nr:MAG: ABC-type spermidine/putrescine transport system, permease component II [halophilic archaeon J07HX64]
MSDESPTRTDGAGETARPGPTTGQSLFRRVNVGRWLFRAGVGTVFVFLLAPVVVVAVTSFGDSITPSFPPAEFSTRWYESFLESSRWQRAARNSLIAAVGTTVLATVAGTTAALGVSNLSARAEGAVLGLAVLPLLVPGVVLGSSLLVFLGEFGLQQSYLAVIAAHSLWATPLAFSVVRASLSRFDPRLREAALDLGASPTRAFVEVVAPNIRSGLLAAALIAFVVSLQEFVMTLFVSGRDTRTIPVLAWNELRNTLDPVVSVVSTLLVLVVVLAVIIGTLVVGIERLAADT